ncbi:nucleotide-binding alpha-beta plait domain-containing protein, partial [Tanacetum coccineum]
MQISLSLLELRTEHDTKQLAQRFVTPLVGDEPLGLKAGFKVKIFRAFSPNRAKKAYCEEGSSDGKSSVRSSDYPFESKEDDVAKISTSIFVSNFPDSVSVKDLFHSCKQYGHVVDSFIPTKRLKDGKRFGFVRFINVFNVERLVNNLCTIWLNRCKLHANIARFNRDQKNGNKYKTANQKKHEGRKNTFYDPSKEAGTFDSRNSFVNVLKGTNMVKETDSSPVIVLEEDCLNSKDLSNSLIGRVKDVGSLSNLKKVLCNEGFDNIFVRYMGELWVLLEFDNTKAKELFRDNVGVGSWFSVLRQASHDFTPEGRIAWVDVERIPFKFWSEKTFKKIATKWLKLLDVDCHDEMSKVHWIRAKEATGWIPEFSEDEEDDDHSEQEFISSEQLNLGLHIDGDDNGVLRCLKQFLENFEWLVKRGSRRILLVEREDNRNSDGAKTNSTGSRKFKMSEIPRTGGSILSVMEEIVKVGITMGYNMDGFLSDHRPILLREASFDYGPTPFRFFHFWFDVDGFDKFVTDSWKDAPRDDSNAMRNLCGKLKFLKDLDETDLIKASYQNAHIDMPFPNSLSTDQQKDLECMVSKEEVKRAVWDCEEQTNHRVQMVLHLDFIDTFGRLLKMMFLRRLSIFFTCGEIPKGCNSTFIALIPKNPDANMVKDFRPISLIGSVTPPKSGSSGM